MILPESRLMQKGKSLAKQYVKHKVKKALTGLLIKLLKWLLATVGPMFFLWLFVLVILFAVVEGVSSTYNFTSAVEQDIEQDEALQGWYEQVSDSTVSEELIEKDETAAMYKVPWGIFAAIDKVLNNCEEPEPEKYASVLKPTFHMMESEITTVTTVTDSEGRYSQSTDVARVDLIDRVDTYQGIYKHHYVWSTTTTTISHTEERTAIDPETEEEYTYTVEVTVQTDITKQILSTIQAPILNDYSRFIDALNSFGIIHESDYEIAWELSRYYGGEEVDTTKPVTDLMRLSDYGSVKGGAPPPEEWIPFFKAAAEEFHGKTDVRQFEALLMAICYTESSFRSGKSIVSHMGAQGPMQFMPATFEEYGVRQLGFSAEDIWDPEKSIRAAALLISKNGASDGTDGGIRRALWRYNQSVSYGDLVVSRMYYYGAYTGWTPTGISLVNPGDSSTKGYYWPVPGYNRITDTFGPRTHPVKGTYSYHEGIDIAAPMLTPIIAPKDGYVEEVNYSNAAYGYYIYIRHDDEVQTFYGHMQSIMPEIVPGAQVKAGQVIALVGSRGWSTGPHLHFGVKYNGYFVNPLLFVNQP